MKRQLFALATVSLLANGPVRSSPSLGTAEAACLADEVGPALMIRVLGLKGRKGLLRAELYPPNDSDFLADDNVLVQQGKTFRRVDVPIPTSGGR